MNREELRSILERKLSPRLLRMGMNVDELTPDLDLVRTGILDSLGFVDLITELETIAGRQVELEKAFDRAGATTLRGITDLFLQDQ